MEVIKLDKTKIKKYLKDLNNLESQLHNDNLKYLKKLIGNMASALINVRGKSPKFKNEVYYGLFKNEKLIGYSFVYSSEFLSNKRSIREFVIDKKYRGVGAGMFFLKKILELEKSRPIFITYIASNPAKYLYFKNGAKPLRSYIYKYKSVTKQKLPDNFKILKIKNQKDIKKYKIDKILINPTIRRTESYIKGILPKSHISLFNNSPGFVLLYNDDIPICYVTINGLISHNFMKPREIVLFLTNKIVNVPVYILYESDIFLNNVISETKLVKVNTLSYIN